MMRPDINFSMVTNTKNGVRLKRENQNFIHKTIIIFSFLLIFVSNYGYSQTLSIQETINYINKKLTENKCKEKISLSKDGILTIANIGTCWTQARPPDSKGNTGYPQTCQMKVSSVEVTEVSCKETKLSWECSFKITCKAGDCMERNCANMSNLRGINVNDYHKFSMKDEYEAQRIVNAFKYLFVKVAEDGTYVPVRSTRKDDDDPFSPHNFTNSNVISNISTQTVPLEKSGGVYNIFVSIGKIGRKFVFDSGASDVSISESLERELINTGVITQKNYLSPALYKLANGSIVECRRILLPEMKVGDFTVKNVTVSVTKGNDVLLLGKSFLDKFSKWTIDNNTQTLKLEK